MTVGGVVVTNATLHNEDYIKGIGSDGEPIREGKDLRIGDTVTVQRAGDVIPQILDLDLLRRPPEPKPYSFPTVCPACGSHAVRDINPKTGREDAVRRCTGGLICPAQAVEKLKHFCSRNAFDIEGLGDKQIDAFHADGLITSPADIFTPQGTRTPRAEGKKLVEWEGYGEVSVRNLFRGHRRAAEASRSTASSTRLASAMSARPMRGCSRASYGTYEAFQAGDDRRRRRRADARSELDAISGIGRDRGAGAGRFLRREAQPRRRSGRSSRR